jgi:hypothetical protein
MDETRFDGLSRAWAQSNTRRGVLGVLAGAAGLRLSETVAKQRHGSRGRSRDAAHRASTAAAQRPIDDFLKTQGTFCIDDEHGGCVIFVPPLNNFLGWAALKDGIGRGASIDYAGIAAAYLKDRGIRLGTTMDGTVSERRLKDGRAEVSVVLHTTNALSWAVPVDVSEPNPDPNPFGDNPLLFGARVPDVVAGAPSALGNSQLKVVFKNSAPGAALPDVLQLANLPPDEHVLELIELSFRGQADGALHKTFDVAEGTPGRLTVAQTGLIGRSSHNGGTADAFPAELVNLKPVGR